MSTEKDRPVTGSLSTEMAGRTVPGMRHVQPILALLYVAGSCSSGGSASGFCTRLDEYVDGVVSGEITEADLLDEIDGLGDPGGRFSTGRDRLRAAVESGDTTTAIDQTFTLQADCMGYRDSR